MCLAAAIFPVIFSSFYEENNVTSKKYNINFFKRLASEVFVSRCHFFTIVVVGTDKTRMQFHVPILTICWQFPSYEFIIKYSDSERNERGELKREDVVQFRFIFLAIVQLEAHVLKKLKCKKINSVNSIRK